MTKTQPIVTMAAAAAFACAPLWRIDQHRSWVLGNGAGFELRRGGNARVWQKFPATQWGLFYDLVGLNGQPVAARVRQIGGTEIVQTVLAGPGQPKGGDAILLADALVTHQVENCLFFMNLQNGTYEVLSYAWMPTAPSTLNEVWVDNHPDWVMIGGAWPGELTQGVTHARHIYQTTDGIINMHSGIPSGSGADPGAALNGVQLRRLVAEPPLFVHDDRLRWLSSLEATHYDVVAGDLGRTACVRRRLQHRDRLLPRERHAGLAAAPID